MELKEYQEKLDNFGKTVDNLLDETRQLSKQVDKFIEDTEKTKQQLDDAINKILNLAPLKSE